MHTLRLSLVGAAMLTLLGGLGGAALAQEGSAPVSVTGTGECHMAAEGVTVNTPDGVERYADHISACVFDADDDRLSGTFDITFDMDCNPSGACLNWATAQWPGPDGWEGQTRGWMSETGEAYEVIIWTGTGANEGLTYVDGGAGDLRGAVTLHGVLYEGPPPVLVPE